MKRSLLAITLVIASAATLAGCIDPQTRAQRRAVLRASEREAYVPKNSLDFINYDKRQRLSDEPTTIVWCTIFPPTPGVRPITYPIVGKLTSGGKRPFADDPGPDGMYGSSGDYRYGFTPGDNMVDVYNVASVCTTEPTVWQKEKTDIVITQDPGLNAAQAAAKAALDRNPNDHAGAYAAITRSIGQ